MKKKNTTSKINLETLAGGAFAEKLNEALQEVAENIQNPNTEATAKRGITVSIKFAPNKNRQMVNTQIAVSTKLAPTEAIDTEMVVGTNIKTGAVEFAEYDSTGGQISIFDSAMEAEPEAPQETDQAEGIVRKLSEKYGAPQDQQDEKPLDLRNRSKAEPEMQPGRDFDPDTGEVIEGTDKLIIFNNKKAVQA